MAQAFRPPATQRLYDVCVIGSQLGGAVAGALLAKRGFRVVYVDHDGAGTYYEDGGYLLPHAPALIPSPRLFPAAEIALSELGFTTDLGRALEPSSPSLQLLFPRHRVDLHAEPSHRAAELRREWPGDAEALEAAFAALAHGFDGASPVLKAMPPLPPDGFGERRALSKAVRFAQSTPASAVDLDVDPLRAIAAHPIGHALRAAQSLMTHLAGEPAPFSTLRLTGAIARGANRIPAAYDGVRDAIRKRIADARGELLGLDGSPASAERLEVDGSRVTAVRLEGSPNAWVARAFVLATDPASVLRLIPEELHRKIGEVAGLRPVRQLLAVNLVVRHAALPPGLGDTALALGNDDGGEPVLIQVLPARREMRKGGAGEVAPDERVVSAATYVAADAWDQGGAGVTEGVARIRSILATVLPFLDRHLVRESVPSLSASSERRRNTRALHPVYASELDAELGVTGIPFRALKNVVFAGREVVPGLGIEGEFHAGVQAAAAAQAILGKKEFLK